MRHQIFAGLIAGLVLAGAGKQASAGHFFHRHEEETPPPGTPRCIPHTHESAGYPLCMSPHAAPTNTEKFCGHYVGGGGGGFCHQSDERCRNEGTWGWDYVGGHWPRKVFLGWNHGRLYQGGTDYYRTDPTVEVPNIFAIRLHHGGE